MDDFKTESWLWFAIVMSVVLLRFLSRVLHFKSFFRFQIEDYLMIIIACAYTIFIVLINICVNTNSNLIDPDGPKPTLTPEDIAERTYGSKVTVGVEQTMCVVQWGTKACLLFLYFRLTENLVHNVFVKAVGAYVASTYVVMEVLYLGYWCRPFSDYWQTPSTNEQCPTALHHLITNFAFNLTSDILVMSIPLPLMLRSHLEFKRKILLCLPFTLGFFSIVCAIISKYVSFTHPYSPAWSFWYTREASCIMIVSNMPYIWGLIRRSFKLRSFWERRSNESENRSELHDEFHDSHAEMVSGEAREIIGIADTSVDSTAHGEKNGIISTCRRISTTTSQNKSMPEIIIDSRDVSQDSSPTGTRSDQSATDERWQNVDWNRNDGLEIVRIPTGQSLLSPESIAPPPIPRPVSPALSSTSTRRSGKGILRRASAMDFRRPSTHSVKHARLSVSEASRKRSRGSVNVDAVDRLYRLDDEALVADLEAARPRSHHSHRNDFG